jgi:hypothetical protein
MIGRTLFSGKLFLAVVAAALPVVAAAQGVSAEDANKSNNPLNPAVSLALQDLYTPRLYGSDAHTNDLLARATIPVLPGEAVKVPQIFRVTAPISTRADPNGGYTTGLGDLNVIDIFLLSKKGGIELGAGPLLSLPSASNDALGSGKWQAGLAAVVVHSSPQGVAGGLVQWQTSVAGDKDRPNTNTLSAQPVFIRNLHDGWYLRSSGTWTFNLDTDDYFIPIGLGAGKVFKSGTTVLNAFLEPQWTVAHHGNGLPKFTVFFGISAQLGR